MARAFPTLPKGETVASFETYAEAQAAVDKLAKADFPVKELAIVGTDLTSVERITGTLSWGRAAGAGALSGAWFGTFLGLLFFIFAPTGASLGILASAVLIGAGFGMIFSVVSYSVNRRRRDFTSVMQVLATRYAIITESAHADRARSVLGVDAPDAHGRPAGHHGDRDAVASDELRRGHGCRAPRRRGTRRVIRARASPLRRDGAHRGRRGGDGCRGIRRPCLRRRRHGAVVGTLTRFADYQLTGFSGVESHTSKKCSRSWPEISSESAMKSAVEAVPPPKRSTQALRELEERLVADLHAQRVQGGRTAVVDRAEEEPERTGVGDDELPELGVVGRDRHDVVERLLGGGSAAVLRPHPLGVASPSPR